MENPVQIFEGFTSPGYSTEILILYLATYKDMDRFNKGGGFASEDENIEVVEMSFIKILELLENNSINDMKTALLVAA